MNLKLRSQAVNHGYPVTPGGQTAKGVRGLVDLRSGNPVGRVFDEYLPDSHYFQQSYPIQRFSI